MAFWIHSRISSGMMAETQLSIYDLDAATALGEMQRGLAALQYDAAE